MMGDNNPENFHTFPVWSPFTVSHAVLFDLKLNICMKDAVGTIITLILVDVIHK